MRTSVLLVALWGFVAATGVCATSASAGTSRICTFAPSRGNAAPPTLRLKGGAKKDKIQDEYSAIQAPKRSLTAYMIYSNQLRPDLMKQNPEMKITEISRHIADRWKKLGDADKVKLQEEADKLKAQYEKKKLEYEEAVPEIVRKDRQLAIKKKKAGKPAKDPNAPKKPLSAFMIFSNRIREKVRADDPALSFGETGRKIAELWNAKTPKEKEEYEKEAVALREKFLVEKSKYEATKPPAPEAPPPKKAKVPKEAKAGGKVAKEPKKEKVKEMKKEEKPK